MNGCKTRVQVVQIRGHLFCVTVKLFKSIFSHSVKCDHRCALLLDHPSNLSEKNIHTVNFLNIRTPKKFVVITLKFELCGSTIE